MKKIVSIIAALALVTSVAACQRKSEDSAGVKSAAPVAAKVEVKKVEKKEALTLEDVNKKAINALVRVKRLEDLAKKAGLQ